MNNELIINGLELKEFRKTYNFTQQKLAEELGMNIRTLQKIEETGREIRKPIQLSLEYIRLKIVDGLSELSKGIQIKTSSPREIITYIYNNRNVFRKEIMYKMLIEAEKTFFHVLELEEKKQQLLDSKKIANNQH